MDGGRYEGKKETLGEEREWKREEREREVDRRERKKLCSLKVIIYI